MPATLPDYELYDAANYLARSDSGRQSLAELLRRLVEQGAMGLDARHQDAVFCLLTGAWNGYAGSAVDAIANALRSTRELTATLSASIEHERRARMTEA